MQTQDYQAVTDTLEGASYERSAFKMRAMWTGDDKVTEYHYYARPDEANTENC